MSRTGINLSEKLQNLGITKSECCQFIPSEKPNECQCGLTKREHAQPLVNSEQNWTRDTCTRPGGITNAYGGIRFADKNEISKYIRVYYRTEMDKMISLLFGKSYWHMKPPKLLISVTGGAQVAVSELVRDILCKGLVKAATSTDGWITTGGTNAGIMKHVGETVRFTRSKVTLIGIASWTATSRNEDLISCDEDTPLRFAKSQYLEPNHTHFILVDDSKYNDFGGEIQFRAKLESEISKIKKIPIILVVVEGGPNTAATVLESLKKSIPCGYKLNWNDFSKPLNIFFDQYLNIQIKNANKRTCAKSFQSQSFVFDFMNFKELSRI
ncbi:transient receptor potential cation channel subfamily M member 2-like [Brachionus plicatilis]|uniref:Transient receptor potential cation channel subfamily M member 2-like n=1 Tax=Brachionus plicatilis TaxID=10195 RepID=A0A3M7QKB2_BRAPC|nr:transient receptor potential cation channel subfamily M member 2-like [Brachionus plicatilis]